MMDKDSKPRGFGFVTFEMPSTVDKVFDTSQHYILGKLVECKWAVPKEVFKVGDSVIDKTTRFKRVEYEESYQKKDSSVVKTR